MTGTPTIYCPTCHALRAVRDWHERHESLSIELDPCGHVTVRNARIEWTTPRIAA
jgi:hypothetical protein